MKCITQNKNIFTSLVEVWKDTQGFEGCFQVSTFGNIRSYDRFRASKGGRMAPIRGRTMKQKISKNGYKVIGLCKDSKKTHPSVHRLVALAFIPNPINKPTVNHKDGNKDNNNISNLEWFTVSEQTQHAFDTKLITPRGKTKYSQGFKKEVFDYYNKTGISISKLSIHFNISERAAGRFAKGIFGQTHSHPDLTDDAVVKIINLRKEGKTLLSIATEFNCGISQIHRITHGKSRNLTYER